MLLNLRKFLMQNLLSKEEMDALAQAVIPKMAAGEKSDDIIEQPEQPNLTAAIDTSDQKVQANPEPVRLPTMKDIQNIDREQLVHTGSETLYENIKVGEPDYNYKKPEGSADGLIIEVHNDPENAWSDGSQSLKFDNFKKVVEKSHKIAAVIGRE